MERQWSRISPSFIEFEVEKESRIALQLEAKIPGGTDHERQFRGSTNAHEAAEASSNINFLTQAMHGGQFALLPLTGRTRFKADSCVLDRQAR